MRQMRCEGIHNFIKNHYPIIIIIGSALIMYGPYLFLEHVVVSSGGVIQYDVFKFLLDGHHGWINLYKCMGEFVGGNSSYGWFHPIFHFFRLIKMTDYYLAEHLLATFYFCGTFGGAYFLLRSNDYKKWIAVFSASLYTLSGYVFGGDIILSAGYANLFFLPLLFLIAQKEFRGIWRKIFFVFLLGLESAYGHPQFIFLQIIFLGLYLLSCKPFKLLKTYLIILFFGVLATLPQLLLTASMFVQSSAIWQMPPDMAAEGEEWTRLILIFFPLFPIIPTGMAVPNQYTNILGPLIFIFFLPAIYKQRKKIPREVLFFAVVAILALISTVKGNPIQKYLLGNLPFASTILARMPIRYIHFYFFSLSLAVAYILQHFLNTKEQIFKFTKKLFFLGAIITGGYVVASLVYIFWSGAIYGKLENYFIAHRLPQTTGGYPKEYYLNLLKNIYYTNFGKFTLLSWGGIFSSLPFVGFTVWGFMQLKNKAKDYSRYWPYLVVFTIIPTALLYSFILQQSSRPLDDPAARADDNDINAAIKKDPNWRDSYVLPYGNYAGQTYYTWLYQNSYGIIDWLKNNYYSDYFNVDGAPSFNNDNPFRLFRYRLITTYIGFMAVDTSAFGPKLNESAVNRDNVNGNLAKLNENLNDRLNFLRNVGVRYIVSHFQLSGPGYNLVKEAAFAEESALVPGYKARLYLYEMNDPGKIIYVPVKIQLVNADKDKLNLQKVKEIFDNLNYQNIVAIETDDPQEKILEQKKEQKIIIKKMGNDAIELATDFSEESYVIININYYPGWEAFVDGKKTDVARANVNFMAVKIPAGSHEVNLRFNALKMIRDSLSGKQ